MNFGPRPAKKKNFYVNSAIDEINQLEMNNKVPVSDKASTHEMSRGDQVFSIIKFFEEKR